MTQEQLLELVKKVSETFSNSGSTKVTRDTILFIQDMIRELYEKRLTNKISNDSFIGNLPRTGRVEGAYKDVIGIVESAIERISENYLNGAYPNNAEILMKNIENMLSKEDFDTVFLENICKNKSQKLTEISKGNF